MKKATNPAITTKTIISIADVFDSALYSCLDRSKLDTLSK